MKELPIKTRHFRDVTSLVSQTWQDVSDLSLERRALSFMFLERFLDKKPSNPSLVSSAHGKLKKIFFTLPFYVLEGGDNPLWDIYADIFLKLPKHTEVYVMVQKCCLEFLKDWTKQNNFADNFKYIIVPDYLNFTIWAEDAYAIVEDKDTGEKHFIEPHSFPRWEDGLIASYASKQLNYKRSQIPLYFEGGNILVGDNFFMMGADYPVISLKYIKELFTHESGEEHADFITKLYNKYLDKERELIFIGSTLPVPSRSENSFEMNGEKWTEFYYRKNERGTVQPIFHIDMFISLAGRSKDGKYRLLVGDPRLASELIDEPVISYAMSELFDNIADNFVRIGFEVIRNPLPLIYLDDEKHKERSWHFASANNVMLEIIDDDNKTVWLPTYGFGNWKELKKTDEYNKNIWEELGFKVILLGDFHPFAENSGSLHCIKKYLERE